jgi:hypothetical protein
MFCIKLSGIQDIDGFVTGDEDGSLHGVMVGDGKDGIEAI